MGSKSRKRKQGARAVERVMADMAVSETPIHVAQQALSRARADVSAPRNPKPKPAHVLALESSGHQYIKGDRATPPLLTPAERKINRDARVPKLKRVRVERTVKDRSGAATTVKALVVEGEHKEHRTRGGHYISDDSGARLVAGVTLQDKDLASVTVRQGERRVLSVRQRRERVENGM